MSFQDTILPDFLIADLYKNVLVESDNKTAKKTIKEVEKNNHLIKFLGENKKQIVFLVNDNEAVYVTEENLHLITNLLTACKLTIADVAIVNMSNKNFIFNDLKKELAPTVLLVMGINAKSFQLPLVFNSYKIQHFGNCQMLITTDIKNLIGDSIEVKNEKKKLWVCLKEIFSI